MATIEIDFDVYKALTARRASESVTYNHVLRDLLGLEGQSEDFDDPDVPYNEAVGELVGGCTYKGVFFPERTQFKAVYKGQTYLAEIRDGGWIMSDGTRCSSPSNAATRITHTNVNGWRFWQAKRPTDADWKLMDLFLL